MSGPIPAVESRQKQVVLAQFHFSGLRVYQDFAGWLNGFRIVALTGASNSHDRSRVVMQLGNR